MSLQFASLYDGQEVIVWSDSLLGLGKDFLIGNITTFIIIINPLTATVVGAPQMILQPVFSNFHCSPLPSETCRTPGLSIP